MVWLQAIASFVVWIAYGVAMRRQSDRLRARLARFPRGVKVFFGSGGLFAGIVVLMVGVYTVATQGGIVNGSMTWWAWLAVTVVGLIFIHLQVLGAAALVSLVIEEETARRRRPSVPSENPQE